MEAVIAFLDREARLFNNVEAAVILSGWRNTKRMPDTAIYAVTRMRKVAAEREKRRKETLAAKIQAKTDAEKVAATTAARDRLKAKLRAAFP